MQQDQELRQEGRKSHGGTRVGPLGCAERTAEVCGNMTPQGCGTSLYLQGNCSNAGAQLGSTGFGALQPGTMEKDGEELLHAFAQDRL